MVLKTRLRKNKNRRNKTKKGGTRFIFGKSTNTNYGTVDRQYNNIPTPVTNKNPSRLPVASATYINEVSKNPNKNPNYVYHSLFMSEIRNMIDNDFDTIKFTINEFLRDFLEKLNNENNNMNKIKFSEKDIKINDFKYTIGGENGNNINMDGSIYVTDINRLNKGLNKSLNRLPSDIVDHEINQYI